jgi:hypothetical protein
MKIKLTKANAFQIVPGKKYLVIINIDKMQWTMAEQDELIKKLEPLGMTVAFLPKGTRYKVVEATDTAGAKS